VDLDEIEVFGVAGWLQVKLVKCGSASKRKRSGDLRMGEKFDQGTRDDEILLDLDVVGPRSNLSPLSNVIERD
jgi:hypothetical protein